MSNIFKDRFSILFTHYYESMFISQKYKYIYSVKRSNESKVNESSDSNVPERHLCLDCNWILVIHFFSLPCVRICCCRMFFFSSLFLFFYKIAGVINIAFSISLDLLSNDLVCKHDNAIRNSPKKKKHIYHTYSFSLFTHIYILI